MSDKAELIKEGTGGIAKLTSVAHYKTLAFCLVVSLIVNCCQGWNNSKLTDRLVKQSEELNEKRIQDLKSMIKQEVDDKIQPIKENVENTTKKVEIGRASGRERGEIRVV